MGPRDQGGVAVAAQPNNLSWPGKVGSGSAGSGSPSSWPEQPGLKYHNRTMSESPGFTDPKYEVMAQGKRTFPYQVCTWSSYMQVLRFKCFVLLSLLWHWLCFNLTALVPHAFDRP
jgi:hypothetical protein